MKNGIFNLLVFTLILTFCSCGDDGSGDGGFSDSSMTATVNGVEWEANSSFYNLIFGQLQGIENVNEAGTNTNVISIQFENSGLPALGEQTVTATYREVRDGGSFTWEDQNGTCNVTSASNDVVKGTFSLTLVATGSNTGAQKVITGSFDSEVK